MTGCGVIQVDGVIHIYRVIQGTEKTYGILREVSQTSVVGNHDLPKPSLHRKGLQRENRVEGMVKGTVGAINRELKTRVNQFPVWGDIKSAQTHPSLEGLQSESGLRACSIK
jgi:hypothetical protein